MSESLAEYKYQASELSAEVTHLAKALDSIIARMEESLKDLARIMATLEAAAEADPWAEPDQAEPDPADSGLVPLADRPYTQKVIDSTAWVPIPVDYSEVMSQPPNHEPPSGPAVVDEIKRLATLAGSLATEDTESIAAQMAVLGSNLTLVEIEHRYKPRWSDDNPDIQPAAVKAWEWLAGYSPTPPSVLWYTGQQAGQAPDWKAG